MRDIETVLEELAASRPRDPLAPVTFVVPSHAAGIQLRRRFAARTAFAAVRFETLPRIAELLAAGRLVAEGRRPLARPIGDYVAGEAALQAEGGLATLAGLPGFARVLRALFRRLRRGGIRSSADIVRPPAGRHFAEILRLYDWFRQRTSGYYDEEDLLERAAQAVRDGQGAALGDLGDVYVLPPWALSAGAQSLLSALAAAVPRYEEVAIAPGTHETRIVLAPDPASEAREAVHEVLRELEAGTPLEDIAVFYGADNAYPLLLREAFEAARIPAVPLPGVPLTETPAGRGVLALLQLPLEDYSRAAVMQFLSVAPLRPDLPVGDGRRVRSMVTAWDRVSREASVTHGRDAWRERLEAHLGEIAVSLETMVENEGRASALEFQRDAAENLRAVMEELIGQLEPLRDAQPAAQFIARLRSVFADYFDRRAESFEAVDHEIEQLGTVGDIGGRFALPDFALSLRANLETAYMRTGKMGEGVLIADHRLAAGLRFKRVLLCGAYEGSLPAGVSAEPIVEDWVWTELRPSHPHIEDLEVRLERSRRAVTDALAAARGGAVTWTCPLYEPGGGRDFYPSSMLVDAAKTVDSGLSTASRLRGFSRESSWFRRSPSPLAVMTRGSVADAPELGLRWAILHRLDKRPLQEHRKWPAVAMLRARRSASFTEWDGNIAAIAGRLNLRRPHSPTSLENYAVCGYRYFARSILGLAAIEEPEEREMMDPAKRGSLVHEVLERFFRAKRDEGRPQVGEAWTEEDAETLLAMLDEALAQAHSRGLTGLPIYHGHEARTLRADLRRFLEEDTLFRRETGAVPVDFELAIPPNSVAGVDLRGRADRLDRTPDGAKAWVIDYKTGDAREYKEIVSNDPLAGGRKLQLPAYLALAQGVSQAQALYWFITQRGGFERIPYEDSPENRRLFERTVGAIVGAAESGIFPAVPGDENEFYGNFDNCKYCDFDRICSRRRNYELEAKSGDAALAPWFAVAQAAKRDA